MSAPADLPAPSGLPAPSTLPGAGRSRWADVAKGACIVLVVLWHVTRKDYLQLPRRAVGLGPVEALPVTGAWGTLSELLLPLRMPLFFAVAGLFALRQADRPWSQVLARRVAPLLWVFVLWTAVQTVLLQLLPGIDTAVAGSPGQLLVQVSVTPGNLWFLLALALYVVVLRATRSAPSLALLAALALSTVAAAGWVPTPGNRFGLLTNLVWFLLGARCAALAADRAGAGPRWVLPGVAGHAPSLRAGLAAGSVFLAASAAVELLGGEHWPGAWPLLGALGVVAGAAAASGLAALGRVADGLAWLGRRTLPVYVLHLPLVAALHGVGRAVVGEGSAAAGWLPLAVAYPVLATALAVAGSLLLHRALLAVGADWLFALPSTAATSRVISRVISRVARGRARGRTPRSAPGPADPASAGPLPRAS